MRSDINIKYSYNMAEDIVRNPELEMLLGNKESGFKYRERRHNDWTENYELYRDKVMYNRLTQRQSVNLPLMKQTIRTLLKDVDDMPILLFENLDNDKDAEIFKNEYWKYTVEQNHMELQDIIDKKQVFLYGRSFKQWQIANGKVKLTIQDPMDILVSRFTDPSNIHSSRFLIHENIFVPLADLENNPDYDKEEVSKLKLWYATEQGLVKLSKNHESKLDKDKRMQEMGDYDVADPVLGETYVELALHFCYRDNDKQLYLYVEAEDHVILMKKPLEEVIGTTKDHYWKTHYPYSTWADDIERQDFWSDAVADMVRTPNKVINSMFSQLIENRTLKNFNMKYYDSTAKEGWQPPTNQPLVAGGWYPLPGKPQDIFQLAPVADLSDSKDDIMFVTQLLEKGTGATAIMQGAQTERQITLGEAQMSLGEAKQRIKGMSKFYTSAWKDDGEIFIKLCEAGKDQLDAVQINKKGNNTNNIYTREISPKDWTTPKGYTFRVWSQDEKNEQDTKSLEKLNAAKINMPNNNKLDEVFKRKLIEFAGLSPDEVNAIMEEEVRNKEMMAQAMSAQAMTAQPGQKIQAPQPRPSGLPTARA